MECGHLEWWEEHVSHIGWHPRRRAYRRRPACLGERRRRRSSAWLVRVGRRTWTATRPRATRTWRARGGNDTCAFVSRHSHTPHVPFFTIWRFKCLSQLFTSTRNKPQHVLHQLLPPPKQTVYNLRSRGHGLTFSVTPSEFMRKNFLHHMLYKDIY